MKLDDKDKIILSLLKQNARIPVSEIARKIHLARTTVQERIARLQIKNVIKGYTVIVSDEHGSRGGLDVVVKLNVDSNAFDNVVSELRKIPSIKRCAAINGSADLFIEISVAKIEQLEQILARIGAIRGVLRTDSNIILNAYF